MNFKYRDWSADATPAFPERKKVFRPAIRVNLNYKDKSISIFALVDSGSDCCMFPSELGEQLGINVKSGIKDKIAGIGNRTYPVYFHNIKIIIGRQRVNVWAGFCDDVSIPILGQVGFFNEFKVRFDYRNKMIDIVLYPKKKMAKKQRMAR